MPWLSLLVGASCAVAAWLTFDYVPFRGAQLHAAAGALVALGGTLVGFMGTALAIFASLVNRDLVQKLIATGHFKQLVQLLLSTAAAFLVVAAASLVALFVRGGVRLEVAMSIALGALVAGVVLLCVAGYRFYLVLTHVR